MIYLEYAKKCKERSTSNYQPFQQMQAIPIVCMQTLFSPIKVYWI